MAKIKKLVFWIFLLIHPFCGYFIFNFFHRLYNSVVENSTDDYDALVFTQSWPKAVCSKWKKESPSNTCLLPAHDNWTIHGIWPTFLNDEGPNYCESSVEFDVAEVASIEEQLLIKWPSVLNKTEANYFQFWKHEWDKHATCSINHPHLNSVIKYFQTGLDLADKYDITKILTNANIQPGKSYDIQEILDKLFFVWRKRSRVTCFRDKKKEKSYLLEISVCLDKGFRVIDCDNVGVGQLTNCKSHLPVIYI